MIDATAIILTKNEEKNIVDCLKSMQGFAKRCVVVDCGSEDRTVELSREFGADVYFHEFEYYAKQFNWAIDNCDISTEWIIRLDADERFPGELNKEIEKLIKENKDKPMNGITIEADLYFLGRVMKHGSHNKRKMMLFKKEYGRIEDRRRDAHSVISEGYSASTKHRFIHHDFKNIDSYIKKYNWYATREMQDYVDYINTGGGINKILIPMQRFLLSGKENMACIIKSLNSYAAGLGLFTILSSGEDSLTARKVLSSVS